MFDLANKCVGHSFFLLDIDNLIFFFFFVICLKSLLIKKKKNLIFFLTFMSNQSGIHGVQAVTFALMDIGSSLHVQPLHMNAHLEMQ